MGKDLLRQALRDAATKKVFTARFIRSRELAGLSQHQLARRAHINRPQVSVIEQGKSFGSLPTVVALANALNVSLDWLVGRLGTDEEPVSLDTLHGLDGPDQPPKDLAVSDALGAVPGGPQDRLAGRGDERRPGATSLTDEAAASSSTKNLAKKLQGTTSGEARGSTAALPADAAAMEETPPMEAHDSWETIARQLAEALLRVQQNEETRLLNERLRIEQVEAVDAQTRARLMTQMEDQFSHPSGRAEGAAPVADA
jgi:transcriptional regulator with XRE-family HTH domain